MRQSSIVLASIFTCSGSGKQHNSWLLGQHFCLGAKGSWLPVPVGFPVGVRALPCSVWVPRVLPQTEINLGSKRLFVLDLSAGHEPSTGLWPWPLKAHSCTRSSSASALSFPAQNLHSFFTPHFLSLFLP